jgi:glycosyltransferase involved in cell wall biosynthesis
VLAIHRIVTPSLLPIAILIPIYNDWESLQHLLPALDAELLPSGRKARVLLVDDGSSLDAGPELQRIVQPLTAIVQVERLRLRCNLGHQRAIAVGLAHLHNHLPQLSTVVVMDGDGEDRPSDVPVLMAEIERTAGLGIVFAARTRRMESMAFIFMYHTYRLLHLILTGVPVRVGNFSAIPARWVPALLCSGDLWNHFAACVLRSKIKCFMVPMPRGRRYAGRSHMRFTGLLLHGLSAMSVFGDFIGVRLLAFTAVLVGVAMALLGVVMTMKYVTNVAIPGWASAAGGILVVVLLQAILLLVVTVFLVLGNRSQTRVVPLRDAGLYVDFVEALRQFDGV